VILTKLVTFVGMKTLPIQFTDEEHAEVTARAKKAGTPLYKYVKRRSLAGAWLTQTPKNP
jgi:hypothetical protein